jgi:hypothetical protein
MTQSLDLNRLKMGMTALTAASGTRLAEAASVCLEEQGHDLNPSLIVTGTGAGTWAMARLAVDATMRACYDDPDEATEEGACAIAILLAEAITGFQVVRRSRKRTGYDYCLGTRDSLDFSARLEVSGIREGTDSMVKARSKQKREQTRQSDSTQGDLPAYAVIVEFSKPQAVVDERR